MFKQTVKAVVVIGSLLMAAQAYAFFAIVHDPINWIQNLLTEINTAKSLITQTKQLQTDLKNLQNYDGNLSQWTDAKGDLQQLSSAVSNSRALSYTMQDMEGAFKERYPDYNANKDYEKDYQKWDQSTLATIERAMANAHMQYQQFDTENHTIDSINQLSQSAQGRMQAVQAGNMLASATVEQLQKLRQLQMEQVSAQSAYVNYRLSKDKYDQQSMSEIDHNLDSTFPKYQDNPNFEAIPSFNN